MRALEPSGQAAEELRRRAKTDGYLYLPGLLPIGRITELRALIEAALTRRGWRVDGRSDPALRLGGSEDARWVEFLNEILPAAPFDALRGAPEIRSVLRTIFGAEPRPAAGDVCRLVSPGSLELTTPPHQDAAYLPDDVWAAWLPIEDCPIELGPLAVLPGSHHHGLLAKIPDDAPWQASPLAVGDVIFFSSLTAHRALPNLTRDQLRVSVDYRYSPR